MWHGEIQIYSREEQWELLFVNKNAWKQVSKENQGIEEIVNRQLVVLVIILSSVIVFYLHFSSALSFYLPIITSPANQLLSSNACTHNSHEHYHETTANQHLITVL